MDMSVVCPVAKRFSPAHLGAALWSVLAVAFLGCKTAPMTNTIIVQAHSPDGQASALLVERYYHAALGSNGFYLLVLSEGQDARKVINDEDIRDSSALVATAAGKVQLRWQDKDTLLVVCDSCGLEAIDISKKLDHVGSIRIIYQGFPEHTAYS
jgi:hypothetical protein